MSIIQTKPLTPADLFAIPDGKSFEMVDGELVERNGGVLSSYVEIATASKLYLFCQASDRGIVLSSSNGLKCFLDDPNKIRKPDVSFIKKARFATEFFHDGFLTITPDLAVEILSPNDVISEIDDKIKDYKDAGIPLIWIIDPELQTVDVYRADGTVSKLSAADELSGENIVPGFQCKVADLFPEAA